MGHQIHCSKQVSIAARYTVMNGSVDVHETFCVMCGVKVVIDLNIKQYV